MSNVFFAQLVGVVFEAQTRQTARACVLALIACFAITLPFQLRPWITANTVTERIISTIQNESASFAPTLIVDNLPDQYQSAFIFRNGLEEADAVVNHQLKNWRPIKKTMQSALKLPIEINGQTIQNSILGRN